MYTDRDSIEQKVSDFNRKHYKKVLETSPYNDTIYEKLLEDTTRDKILSGELEKEEVDNEYLYDLLCMLKGDIDKEKPHLQILN